MQGYEIDTDPLFEELKDHLSATDLDSLRQIVDETRRKIERFGAGMFR